MQCLFGRGTHHCSNELPRRAVRYVLAVVVMMEYWWWERVERAEVRVICMAGD
jgi:hypothetical protein